MTRELFTIAAKRKYLTLDEQFIAAANALELAEVRTFALTLAYSFRLSNFRSPRTYSGARGLVR